MRHGNTGVYGIHAPCVDSLVVFPHIDASACLLLHGHLSDLQLRWAGQRTAMEESLHFDLAKFFGDPRATFIFVNEAVSTKHAIGRGAVTGRFGW